MRDTIFILFSIYIILYIWSVIAGIKMYIKDKFDEYLKLKENNFKENLNFLLNKDDFICLYIYIPILCAVLIPFVLIRELNEIVDCSIDKKDYL